MMDKNRNTDEVPRGTIIGALMYTDLNTFKLIKVICHKLRNLDAYIRTVRVQNRPRF